MVQDDICHKECNVAEFGYDSGACCEILAHSLNCHGDCYCHAKMVLTQESCFNKDWIGNEVCQPLCYHRVYNYDGGDCMG